MGPLLLVAATLMHQASAAKLNAFGMAVMKASVPAAGNALFSPVSAGAAMALLLNASTGSTNAEIRRAMGYDGSSLDTANAETSGVLRALLDGRNGEVMLANAIFAPAGMELGESFVRDTQTNFGATVERLNGGNGAAQVNQWVAQATKNRITRLFDSLAPNSAVLANAITFDGHWARPFVVARTKGLAFHGAGGDQQVSMMSRTGIMVYRDLPDHEEVELPYVGDRFAMRVLLPKGDDPASILTGLSPLPPDDQASRNVDLLLPKFTFSADNDLRQGLTAVGLGSLFVRAEVGRMSPNHPVTRVSQAVQKAWIEVDESGTKAAAATGFAMPTVVFGGRTAIPFHVDRPFAFVLEDKTSGAILFAGIVRRVP